MGKILAAITAFFRALLRGGGGGQRPVTATEATDRARAAVRAQLRAAAANHRVNVDLEALMYMVTTDGFVAHVPIDGFGRYEDADIEAGAPIHLLLVQSAKPRSLPNGTYVVKGRHTRGARSGIATFIDGAGTEAGRSELSIRSWPEGTEDFPGFQPGGEPQGIARVTSGHWYYDYGLQGGVGQRWVVDAAGWIPYRVVWYGPPE